MPSHKRQKFDVQLGARWLLDVAAKELAVDQRSLLLKLNGAGIRAGEDGRYSTLDLFHSIAGDRHAEKRRKEKLEADRIQQENDRASGLLVSTAAVVGFVEKLSQSFRKIITDDRSIGRETKDNLLAALASADIADDVPECRPPADS